MEYICRREEDGGLGYRRAENNTVNNGFFIPAHLAEFISKSEPDVWRRLCSKYKGDEHALLADLVKEIFDIYADSQNAATFFNKNRTLNFGGEEVPLYYVSGTELQGDKDFEKNIFAAVEESSHNVKMDDNALYAVRPDVSFFLNGIFIGYMELKSVVMGQSAARNGREKVVKDYLSSIKAYADIATEENNKARRKVLALYEKAIHLTASDINETYVIRNISSLYDMAYARLAGAMPKPVDDIAPEFLKVFKSYPFTSLALSEKQRFEQIMAALYSKRMIEKEILYYNFMEYKFERTSNGKLKASHHGRLISPRPKQKFGCDKIMNRIVEMLDHEKEPNYYMNKLRRELIALDIPTQKIEEIILKREQYCNNKFVYSLLMQYAAGFGKSNIIGWTALQLKDFRYGEGNPYAYDKIMLVVDRLQLRDQLETTMRNMNIDKSMFIEAIDKKTFIDALDSPTRIIVVNIQKFLDLQEAIDASGTKLGKMRVAFLIDEIHRSNSGENNAEMINLFERLQASFKGNEGQKIVKKNLLVGFTATPGEDTLARFGEFKSAEIVPLWVPFDSYTMKEAIEDGYILDPTKHIYPYTVPVKFDADAISDEDEDTPIKIKHSKELVYGYEPRMKKIAEFIVDRLVSLVYGKIRGEGKAMFAVSSIPNAIKYLGLIRELYAEKCQQKPYDKYIDAPISIVYSDNQKYTPCAQLNYNKSESMVISEFKQAKNGLIIVVDKLQTGFDEPKLHTLFLDKEIADINAIQTISRVNRTCKNKNECHVIDCSWKNANIANIKAAFKKFCNMVVSDFNPEEQAVNIANFYKALCSYDIYKNWYASFKNSADDTSFILSMEDAFRAWIKQCFAREAAIKEENIKHGWKEGDAEYKTPENEAKDLRILISQYSGAIESVKNVYDINEKYYDETFLAFWKVYCHIYREATRKTSDDDVYVVAPIDIDEAGFTLSNEEPEEKGGGGKGPKGRPSEPKSKTISDVIKLIRKLNEKEQVSLLCVQEWLKEIGQFFHFLSEDADLCAYLRNKGFTEEDKALRFNRSLSKYCRTLKKRTDITDIERLVTLIKDNEEQLRATFMANLSDVDSDAAPDFDYDTTGVVTPSSEEDLIAKIKELYDPTYDGTKVRAAIIEKFKEQFSGLCGVRRLYGVLYKDFEDVVDSFFTIVRKVTLEDLDGLNESVLDNLNRYFFALNNPKSLKSIFKGLLLDLEPFLRKICYLRDGKVFDEYEGWVPVVREIRPLNSLYYTTNPSLADFKLFYNTVYNWRNDNAHKAPILPDDEIDAAIYMVMCIYLYATMVSISDLEKNGVFNAVIYSMNSVSSMAAESHAYGSNE